MTLTARRLVKQWEAERRAKRDKAWRTSYSKQFPTSRQVAKIQPEQAVKVQNPKGENPDEKAFRLPKKLKDYKTSRPLNPEMLVFMALHNIQIKRIDSWRWLNPPKQGEVEGVPNSNGTARMTNGVIVVIERPNGKLFWGHYDKFIEYKDLLTDEQKAERRADSVAKAKATRAANMSKKILQTTAGALELLEKLRAAETQTTQ